jgi:hypothetical protein
MPAINTRGGMSAQAFGWTTSIGKVNFIGLYGNTSSSNVISYASKIDASGNIYMAGTYSSGSTTSGIIVKYNSKGAILWQRILTPFSTETVYFYSITVNSLGDVFVAGTYYTGSRYLFIAKYNSSGVYQYSKTLHTASQYQDGKSIAIDSSDNIFVVGYTYDGSTNYDTILIKYDSSGTLQWQTRLYETSAQSSLGNSVVVDGSGNIYISGSGGANILTIKCDSTGAILWQKAAIASSVAIYGYSIAVDSSGNVWNCGYVSFAPNILYVIKYDSLGNFVGNRTLAFDDVSRATSIVLDNSGNAYICGSTNYAATGYDFQILKLDSSLSILWQRSLGNSTSLVDDIAVSINVDNLGNFFVLGYATSGTTRFLFAKLPTSGALTGTYTVGTYPVSYQESSGTFDNPSYTYSTYTLSTTPSSFTEDTFAWSDASVSQTSTVKYI